MFCGNYRTYSSDIPVYLHNKLRGFIQHCVNRMASKCDLSGISCKGDGKFSVLSFSNQQKSCYDLSFGDENTMPKCSCPDWSITGYPCKHFFAVFETFPAWSWQNMSSLYTKSPFLNLDDEIIPILLSAVDDSNEVPREKNICADDETYNNDSIDSNDGDFDFQELPQKKKWKATTSTLFREYLKDIKDMSYIVENEEVLTEALSLLTDIKSLLNAAVPTESGIALENTSDVRGKRRKVPFKNFQIPLRKKRDGLAGRHGELLLLLLSIYLNLASIQVLKR